MNKETKKKSFLNACLPPASVICEVTGPSALSKLKQLVLKEKSSPSKF